MGGREGEDESLLPPDYVSLAQLQEQWLQKQQEKKLREKQVEEKRNDERRKMVAASARHVVGRRVENNGGEMGVIDVKGKGKEMVIGGNENGEENKKIKKKKGRKNKRSKKTKSAGDEEKGKEAEKEKVGFENGVENRKEIVSENGLEGIEEASVCMVEVMPINGVKGGLPDVKRMDFRCGFRKNGGNRGSFCRSEKEHGGRLNQLKQNEGASASGGKMDDENRYDKKWGDSGRGRKNGEYLEGHNRLKEIRVDVLIGNETEPETEKKAEDVILNVVIEKNSLSGRDRNGYKGRNKTKEDRVKGEGLNDGMALEKKVDEKGYGKKWRGGRYGEYRERFNRFKGSRDDVLIGNEVEPGTEKKIEDKILEVFSEKCGLSRGERYDDKRRNKTNEDRVEGEGLSDDRVALEKKMDHEVLMEECVKNGEKGGVGKGYMRYGNWKGNFSESRYRRFERRDDHQKRKQGGSGMMWVKKEENSVADAPDIGSSGVKHIGSY